VGQSGGSGKKISVLWNKYPEPTKQAIFTGLNAIIASQNRGYSSVYIRINQSILYILRTGHKAPIWGINQLLIKGVIRRKKKENIRAIGIYFFSL